MPHQSHDRGGDSYRPSYYRDDDPPPPPPPEMFQFRGAAASRDRRYRDDRSNFNFRPKPKISNRPLLRAREGSYEERILNTVASNGDRFRNLEDMTDSDEADMEDSEDEQEDRPNIKRMKISDDTQEDDKKKWSNPDPYTALPAPSESTGKKLDFVKLIRKARNENNKSSDLAANDENFISFGDMESDNNDTTLGKRKRGDKNGNRMLGPAGRRFYADGMVLDEWRPRDGIHPTPWLRPHQDSSSGVALHKEIIDFYDWVRPRDYEFEVRAGVIERLSNALNRIEPGELKAFGSYAAGLYLPVGDMDLVYLPRGFNRRQFSREGISHNQFKRYGNFVRDRNLARPGTITLIPKAKVPIIKFVERVSGLKVDLSFNNDTGVIANETFQKWREQYPVMPILTSVVKQFLMIRGLNDVSVGGLGGFSTICLVTSILQHMPQAGNPPNLGNLLLEFFNVYGNVFNRDQVAIRLDPPSYIDKKTYMPHLYSREKEGRLTIVDPNRPDNNISGGSHEIERVFSCFSRAYDVLQRKLIDYESQDDRSRNAFSFLEDLVGGNFTAYEVQRNVLHQLQHGRDAPAPAIIPPPPPPISQEPLPPPPPPPPSKPVAKRQNSAQNARNNVNGRSNADESPAVSKPGAKKTTKAERRATRLKTLRPDLASSVGSSISLEDAVQLGHYRDYNEMDKDLTQRELVISAE